MNHYNFEPSFARPGEGHDKGGVESRGKHIRLQHLVPIPRGGSLREIAEQLVRDLDKQAAERKDAASKSVLERFEAERPFLRRLPPAPFEARRTAALEVSSKATVLLGGGWYWVPSNWKRLSITAYVGVEDVRFVCRGELVTRPRVRFGGREIRYRDYLSELAKKPQAVRQIAPELTAELGEPFGKLWSVLTESHGGLEAGRLFAKIVGAITKQGEGPVRAALEQALGSAVLSMGEGGAPGKVYRPRHGTRSRLAQGLRGRGRVRARLRPPPRGRWPVIHARSASLRPAPEHRTETGARVVWTRSEMRRAGFGEAPDALGTLLAAATAGSSAGLHGLALLLDGPKTAPEEIAESVSSRAVELRGVRVERGQERAREAKRNELGVGPRSVFAGSSHVDPSNCITVSLRHGLAARENRTTVSGGELR